MKMPISYLGARMGYLLAAHKASNLKEPVPVPVDLSPREAWTSYLKDLVRVDGCGGDVGRHADDIYKLLLNYTDEEIQEARRLDMESSAKHQASEAARMASRQA